MANPQNPQGGSNKVTNLLVSSSRANNGSHSLAVQMSFDGVSDVYASIAVPLCQTGGVNLAGYTLSFWVYIVPTFASQTLVFGQSVSGFAWGPNSGDSGGIGWLGGQPNNTWLPITATYTDSGLMDHLNIMFLSSVQWSGTMYVDDIQLTAP
jgi:hypothetical protein